MSGYEQPKKILLGGVPFGCDNIGDEAILECSVKLLRQYAPNCEITVATGDAENTIKKLNIGACSLIGFPEFMDNRLILRELQAHDSFVWCGATGLSDYPEVPLRLVSMAQDLGKKTMIWGVGMNKELNPALYRVQEGRRKKLLSAVTTLSFGAVDAVSIEESRREHRAKQKIRTYLNRADLVIVRDTETRELLMQTGVTKDVIVGGDAAFALQACALDDVPLDEKTRNLLASNKRKIGVCISAQREVKNRKGCLEFLDALVKDEETLLVFIPMNPVTDTKVMQAMQRDMRYPDRTVVLERVIEPAQVMSVVSCLDAVVSSRLHLLIFAANAHVPIVAIARGTKFDNFLRHYDLAPAGTVENCDFGKLMDRTREAVAGKAEFENKCKTVNTGLQTRLAEAAQFLCREIEE